MPLPCPLRPRSRRDGSPSGPARVTSTSSSISCERAHRSVPADHRALEPLEGSEEADRLAALSGYCFARFAPAERLPILKCAGVVSIVSFNGEPAPVPDDEVDGIRSWSKATLPYDPCPLIDEGCGWKWCTGRSKASSAACCARTTRHASCCRWISSASGVSVQVDAADVRAL